MLKTVAIILYVLAGVLVLLGMFGVLDDSGMPRITIISSAVGVVISGLFLHALAQIGLDIQKNNEYLHIQTYGEDEDEGDEYEDDEEDGEDEADEDDQDTDADPQPGNAQKANSDS